MKPIRLLRSAMTVGFWTFMSRIFGLMREIMIMAMIGPGPVLDAFVAAFRLPNMFRRFFAEGALNAAFVPMFSKRLERNDAPNEFASEAFSGLAFVLLCLTTAAMIFMPALVYATAEGFAGTDRFEITVSYGRVMFPYILLISLAAILSGALNAAGHFAIAAAAPVLLNIMIVGALAIAWTLGLPIVDTLVWTVPFAGIAQFALVYWSAQRNGLKIVPPRPRWTPNMKLLVFTALPAAFANGIMQINLLVGQHVASAYEGAIGWLYAADRLYQLPLGVIGIAIGIVLLPDLSRRLTAQDDSGAKWAYSRASEFAMALTIPAAVALIVVSEPLVSVLYQRGETSGMDIQKIALVTAIYALGLPAFVMQKVITPLYFARGDTKTPTRFAVVGLLVNTVVAIGGSYYVDWYATAAAVAISAWLMLGLLAWGTRRLGPATQLDARYWGKLWRIVLSSLGMGAVLFYAAFQTQSWYYMPTWRYAALLGLIALGVLSYAALAQITGALRIKDLKTIAQRSR